MKLRNILLISAVGLVVMAAFVCYQFSRAFRFPGDRGAIYDSWETANNQFKVRITAYYEEGIVMPGAFFICESAPVGSNEWQEFNAFRTDEAVRISVFRERFRFANDQTAYFYPQDDFLVTTDAGRNWSTVRTIFPKPGGPPLYWAIAEARVEADGKGQAKIEAYDDEAKDRVSLEVNTEDYGRSWSVAQGTAKHNKRLQPTPR